MKLYSLASLTLLNLIRPLCLARCSQLIVCCLYLGCECMGWLDLTDLQSNMHLLLCRAVQCNQLILMCLGVIILHMIVCTVIDYCSSSGSLFFAALRQNNLRICSNNIKCQILDLYLYLLTLHNCTVT